MHAREDELLTELGLGKIYRRNIKYQRSNIKNTNQKSKRTKKR